MTGSNPMTTGSVIKFNGIITHSIDPNEMLMEIAKEEIEGVFMIVQRKEGLTFHSNFPDSNLALRLVEEFKYKLLSGDFS